MSDPNAPMQAPPPPGMGGPPTEPHRGTMILVFGILGLVCCAIFGVVAWVMGSGDLKKMDAGQMDPSGRGTTKAGMICGIIATILWIVAIVIQLVMGVTLIPLQG